MSESSSTPASPILVVGRTGQVASALARIERIAGHELVCLGRPDLDMTSRASLRRAFDLYAPAAVINAAAYTAVDKAETDQEAAFEANAIAPGVLAGLCDARGIPFVHLSTDYVFDGEAVIPYCENDAIAPLGVYGASKAAGEDAVRKVCRQHVILRTAWVYSADGNNFLKTMRRLGAERDELGVVADQQGTPTYARDIANAIGQVLERGLANPGETSWGTYHLTNAGTTTWHGFATEIFRLNSAAGFRIPKLRPIATSDYPTPARRPKFSVLNTEKIACAFGVKLPLWSDSVRDCIDELVSARPSEG